MKTISSRASYCTAAFGRSSRLSHSARLAGLVLLVLAAAIAGAPQAALACGKPDPAFLEVLANQAADANPAKADSAIAILRNAGPDGLEALFKVHQVAIQSHLNGQALADERWNRIQHAFDTVGAQRDCAASGLFWFTDLEQAKAAARSSGKPILSLRLLGRLDEELSCANSRFFRTTLYANHEVAAYLKDHFVLHWKSVRPVPKITIDFGDGRKLQRTVTGNSIHYVLDREGTVIDALPGLYGAREFLRTLANAVAIERNCSAMESPQRAQALQSYHQSRLAALNNDWNRDIARLATPVALTLNAAAPQPPNEPPSAEKAARVTASKMPAEMPLLRRTGGRRADSPAGADDATWAALAALHTQDARLDDGARSLIRAKNPTALQAAEVARYKREVEDPLLTMLTNLERSIAEDTVRNEYLLHSTIHQWLSSTIVPDVDQLNRRIYSDLFLTPDSDPWLGLVTPGVFSALDCGGLVTANITAPQTQ